MSLKDAVTPHESPSQTEIIKAVEALTDSQRYLQNLADTTDLDRNRWIRLAERHSYPFPFRPKSGQRTTAAILGYYERGNFFDPKIDHFHQATDFFMPRTENGSPMVIVAPCDGYVGYIRKTTGMGDPRVANQVNVHFFDPKGKTLWKFVHLERESIPDSIYNYQPLNPTFVKAGEVIGEVATWNIPVEEYEAAGVEYPPKVKEAIQQAGGGLGSHVHLAISHGVSVSSYGYPDDWIEEIASYNTVNPLLLLPRLFADQPIPPAN